MKCSYRPPKHAVNQKRYKSSKLLYLILLTGILLGAQIQAADVFTDRFDYPPEDTVIITGTGFEYGETVSVQIFHLDGDTPATEDYDPWYVTANSYGIFETSWIVPWDALGKTLQVTAEGQNSGFIATATFQDNNTILVLESVLPDTLCPGPIEFCVTLYEQCTGGGFVPLPDRPILFFVNDQNCGVDVGQGALDTVLTDIDGEACFYYDLSAYSGYTTIRAKFLGEDKPGQSDPPNSECDSTRRVQLAASNYCDDYIFDSSACNEPPVATCPSDTTIFLCDLQEVCLTGFDCYDPDANLATCDISTGYLSGGDVCFTPTGPGIYTLILIATDSAGLADTCETNVTITLNSPPQVTCPPDTALFVCNLLPVCIPGFTAFDPDDNIDTLYVEGCELYGDTVCFNPVEGVKEIAFIAVDECGQADTCVTYVTIDLNANPVCNLPANDTFLVCGDTTFEFIVSAYDADGNLDSCFKAYGPGTYTDTIWSFTTTGPGVYSAGFQCVDACGSHCEGVVDITVIYNEAPVITCPDDTTIECTESTHPDNTGWATATDDNDPSPEIVYSDSETAGSCPQEKTITRTWIVTDNCGAKDTCQQIINVVDTTPPVVSCPASTTVECNESTHPDNTGYATAADNCDDVPDITYFDDTAPGSCPDEYTITRNWVATDDCGNADTCQQTIEVVDTTAPVVSCPANMTVECNESTHPDNTGYATATDNCDDAPDITYFDETTAGSCPDEYTITRNWVATDDCGNADTCQQTIDVVDTTPPVISCPDEVTVECNASTHPDSTGWATATDNCDPDPGISYSDSNGGGIITRMWVATDRCGKADTCYQTINIDDTTPPVVSCPDEVTMQCHESTHPDNTGYATATDNCDDTPDVTYFDETTPGSCPDAYTITRNWVATDDAGLSDTCQQIINVVDTTPPVVSCPTSTTVECNESTHPDNTGYATATDNCDDAPDITYFDETTAGSCPDEYTITRNWVATDDCGNADTCQQTIEVVDTTAPVVSCPTNTTVECNESTHPDNTGYATATDTCDDTPDITYFDETTAGSCPDEYTITRSWVATDDCGNADTCQQTIEVVDTTPPVISCPDEATIECNASTHPDSTGWAAATDNCDPDPVIIYSDSKSGIVITRMWVATDRCGNADTCYQTINIVDTTPPVVSCPDEATVQCHESTHPDNTGYATATDNCDDAPDVAYFDETTPGSCPDAYTITRSWVATDDAGLSDTCQQIINVVDTTPPVVSCPASTTVECNESTHPDNTGYATATDNCDDVPDITYFDETTAGSCPDEYTITRNWVATDDCGNADTCQQTIEVVDTTPPVAGCPADVTVECNESTHPDNTGYATADDNCDDAPDISHFDETTPGSCPDAYTITRSWVATDNCGNADTCQQTIYVIDTIPPVIDCPDNVTIECDASTHPDSLGWATATDNCDPDPDISYADERDALILTRTWFAVDRCGNVDSCKQTITMLDTTPPEIECPSDLAIECDVPADPSNTGLPTATDNCDDELEITFVDDTTLGDCPHSFTITRTWRATDDDNNFDECVQTITVEDTTPPIFDICPPEDTVECNQSTDPDSTGWPQVSDNCDPDPGFTYTDNIATNGCPQEYVILRSWIATDVCGNADTCQQTIRVVDTTPPVISCPPDADVVCDGSTDPSATGYATATDNCDSEPEITYDDNSGTSTIVRTWTATDGCGNSSQCEQTITIVESDPPFADCPGDQTKYVASVPAEICVPGFTGDLATIIDVEGGTFDGNEVCFIAPDTGIYTIVMTDINECGESDVCSTDVRVEVVSDCPIVTIEKTHNTLQGHYEYVSVTIENLTYEMGGFDFLIAYDASALTAMDAIPGQLLEDCEWEYFSYRFGVQGNCGDACPSGLLRIIAIAETNNGAHTPLCFGPPDFDSYELAIIRFYVTNDRSFECQYVPIKFFWDDCGDNSISSADGNTLYIDRAIYDFEEVIIWDEEDDDLFPEDARIPFVGAPDYCMNYDPDKPTAIRCIDFVFGGIDIICADSIDDRGDINLNGVVNEVADAVVFTNYFIFGLEAFDINVEGQTAATDVNADGIALSVADLVYLIRIIVGDAIAMPKISPEQPAEFTSHGGVINVDADLGAAYIILKGDVRVALGNDALHMDMISRFDGINTKVLIYSFEKSETFTGDILVADAQIVSAEAADYYGSKFISKLLPQEFSVKCYPNPFNPVATIELRLPTAAEWDLTIYNVTGQKVTDFAGFGEAGTIEITWDASGYASGIYFYKVSAGAFTVTNKMILIK